MGRRMTLCGIRTEDESLVGGISDGKRRGWAGSIIKLHNNEQQSLSPEWSISEVGTPLPHYLNKLHILVASNNDNITEAMLKLIIT